MSADAQLASTHAGVLYLVELGFSTGTQRLTNWTHNLDWAGYTWTGLGAVLSVTPVSESEALQYPALDIGLNIANPSLLALALGNVAAYRRKPLTLYYCVLDDELRALGDPEVCWAGWMDQVRVKTGNGESDNGAVSLRCEIPGKDTRATRSLRLNNAQQQARWPGDTGLSRIEALNGKPVPWLSQRFQRI